MLLSKALILVGASSLAAAQTTGKLGDAAVISDNPVGAVYVAIFNGTIHGIVNATSGHDGKGINFNVQVSGFNSSAGPFKYHVHVNPVPSDGNCTGTGGHLDPYQREDTPACNNTNPATCEVGDLSGKYGTVPGPIVTKNFTDLYTSLTPGSKAFFGNRSFVFHDASSARIACANFTRVEAGKASEDSCDA